jgi:toxin HigB-1
MKVYLEPQLLKKLEDINKKKPQLAKKVRKQLKSFSLNPKHPSLKTHKLKGSLSERWSISIEDNIRMLYYLNGEEAVFFDIGTHDEVYKKKS